MSRPRRRGSKRGEKTDLPETLIWWLLQAMLVGVSLFISDGHDVYRLPKQLLFESAAVVLAAACAMVSILGWRGGILQRLAAHRGALILAGAAVAWTAIATAASTNRALSLQTLLWVSCCAAFFLCTVALAERRQIHGATSALIGPAIVAAIAVLQRLELWNPLRFEAGLPKRLHTTGLIGNPDDLGGYLVVPIIAVLALVVAQRGVMRLVHAAVTLLLIAGAVASETVTAFAALAAAGLVLLLLLSRRAALRVALGAAVAAGIVFALGVPLAHRAREIASELMLGRFESAMSFRFEGFIVAWKMFTEHPLFGVGPGCFAYWYLPYNILMAGAHPRFLLMSQNYHDVHNDHLQLLATTGLVGYALFIAALWMLVARSRGEAVNARRRFARLVAAPLAAGVAVVTLAQFPLELAAPTMMILYFAALAISWSEARE
jgi:O-antigen ligase